MAGPRFLLDDMMMKFWLFFKVCRSFYFVLRLACIVPVVVESFDGSLNL